ncbi:MULTISPECIES: hypothetical protein [unclassified Streptomyces]|uniref:hypothetical protein n=1 Tax=unclassified Streptomyces TaxID=2593676 RepID=UPI00224FE583|nr:MULTISPECIES: hypothetical protein [unclassified Streptomyces]WSP57222.1 hypothetical protein OG306_24705 [Streptomyces sp. NBC_01241]WSU22060.1 hypothetical protein OG508_14525 [Streptomyces sp. NBC_01108]MCX4789034.1 hypothetical protein [Streptomyces sp. NBC_01221]MCX4795220.1 hypothetical protein [Streptomyces sp. NBC_01242]WSJ36533.1 hypothetical protein OG772_11145 [Streptomyces sp. NBC_01321]
MSNGFFYSYHLGWSRPDAESLFGDLDAAGLRLSHPVTRRVTLLCPEPDPRGTLSWVTREQLVLLAGLQRIDTVDFLLWTNSGTDVPARVRRMRDGVVALEFGFGRLTRDEQEMAARAIREAIGRASVLCIGFVVDREGASAATDWSDVVINGTTFFDSWPDTLAVRHEIAATQPQLSGVASYDQSPWMLFGSEIPSR